jgi:protein MAK16
MTELPHDLGEAAKVLAEKLPEGYWSRWVIHRCKLRVKAYLEMHARMRKMRKAAAPKLIGINKKVERREKTREYKALAAARLESSIQKELLERLQAGTYGDIYNLDAQQYAEVLDEVEDELEIEFVDDEAATAAARPPADFEDMFEMEQEEEAADLEAAAH